jgi:hypothetical protein
MACLRRLMPCARKNPRDIARRAGNRYMFFERCRTPKKPIYENTLLIARKNMVSSVSTKSRRLTGEVGASRLLFVYRGLDHGQKEN